MTQDTQPIPLDDFLRHIAESLEKARLAAEGVVLEDQGNTYRITYEGRAAQGSHTAPGEDPFLTLSGAFESAEPADVANHKHDYLAEAYDKRHTS
jgi:hypothetical protein